MNISLNKVCNLLNKIESKRIELIVGRICEAPLESIEKAFEEIEIQKFEEYYSIEAEDFKFLIKSLFNLISKAFCEGTIDELTQKMLDSGLDAENLEQFSIGYNKYTPNLGNRLKEKAAQNKKSVVSITSNIQIPIENSELATLQRNSLKPDGNSKELHYNIDSKNPITEFKLNLMDGETISMGFEKQDLQNFYEELEILKEKLDVLYT